MKAKLRGKKYILELSESEVAAISAALDSVSSFYEGETYKDVVDFQDVFDGAVYKAKKEGEVGVKKIKTCLSVTEIDRVNFLWFVNQRTIYSISRILKRAPETCSKVLFKTREEWEDWYSDIKPQKEEII